MERIRKLILIGLMGWIFIMIGCVKIGKSKEDVAKEVLKNKYNEEFIVHEIDSFPDGFDATVSPVNNPEVLFIARMGNDGESETDDYYVSYYENLVNRKLSEELNCFFPGCYVRTTIKSSDIEIQGNIIGLNLNEILRKITENGGDVGYGICLIYINKERMINSDYIGEYQFFSTTIDKEVEERSMIPICIQLYWLDEETVDRIQNYYKKDIDWDETFESEILGVENYKYGINSENGTDVGNPPNISASFLKDREGETNVDEYIRRRELLEK